MTETTSAAMGDSLSALTFYIIMACCVTSVTSQDCASEFHLPRNSEVHKIPVRLFFKFPWQCFLTDPIDERSVAFVNSLSQTLIGVHNATQWLKKIAMKSFGNYAESVIKVDYDILSTKKITAQHQLEVAKDLYANIFELGRSVTLNGTLLSLYKPPALLLENAAGKTLHAYVTDVFESPCELLIKSDTCENGATCEIDKGLPYCRCIAGYEGVGCQKWKKEQERRALTILIILLVMMAFCITIFIFVTCCKSPLHFRLRHPLPKFAKKAALSGGESQAVITTPKTVVPRSPERVQCPPKTTAATDCELHVPCEIPVYNSPRITTDGTAVAHGGYSLHITPATPLRPPVLLPLSQVPSARVSSRPTQNYLKVNRNKFQLYKCNGQFDWKRN